MGGVIVVAVLVLAVLVALLVVALDLRRLVARSLAGRGVAFRDAVDGEEVEASGDETSRSGRFTSALDEVEAVELQHEDEELAARVPGSIDTGPEDVDEEHERPRSRTPNLDRLRAEGWAR